MATVSEIKLLIALSECAERLCLFDEPAAGKASAELFHYVADTGSSQYPVQVKVKVLRWHDLPGFVLCRAEDGSTLQVEIQKIRRAE